MIFKKPEPLDPEIAGLLAHERELVRAAPDLKARVLSRALSASTASLPVGAGSSWARLVGPRFVRLRLIGLGVGLASVSVAGWYAFDSADSVGAASPIVAPIVERAEALKSPLNGLARGESGNLEPAASVEGPTLDASSEPATSNRPQPTSSSAADSQELILLQRARVSLNKGAYRATLNDLAEHQRRFPASALAEEREALRIRALLGSGRREEAQRAAEGFRRRYPRSVLAPQLGQAGSAP